MKGLTRTLEYHFLSTYYQTVLNALCYLVGNNSISIGEATKLPKVINLLNGDAMVQNWPNLKCLSDAFFFFKW